MAQFLKNADAMNAPDEQRIRIHQFDRQQWWNDYSQIAMTAPAPPHFSLLEFLPVQNERLIPQQALSGLTNLADGDLVRYTGEDMQVLHRHLSAHTRHLLNRQNSDENGPRADSCPRESHTPRSLGRLSGARVW